MTSWKLLYENRFPRRADGGSFSIDHYRAPDGAQSFASGPVFMMFTGFPGFGIASGRNITYTPVGRFRDLIGVDVTMDFVLVNLTEGASVPLFEVVGGLSATLSASAMSPSSANGKVACRLSVAINGANAIIESLSFRLPEFGLDHQRRRLRVRWSTTGQLHVWLDGALIAYENAFQPDFRFDLDRVTIGDAEAPMSGMINASITYFRVVQLREEDPVGSLAEQLDPECIPEISERCKEMAEFELFDMLRQARRLMAGFNASQTSAWRKGDGGSPFTPDALALHKAGDGAGEAFARYMRDGEAQSRQRVLDKLSEVLKGLATVQPQAFKQLVVDNRMMREDFDRHCKDAVAVIRSTNPRLFEKLDPLSCDLETLIQNLAGEA